MTRLLELQIEVEVESDAERFADKVADVLTEHANDLRDPKKELPASGAREYAAGTLEWYAKLPSAAQEG